MRPLALILSLVIHDVLTRRWPQWATLAGIVSIVVGAVAGRTFSRSELGDEFVRLLF